MAALGCCESASGTRGTAGASPHRVPCLWVHTQWSYLGVTRQFYFQHFEGPPHSFHAGCDCLAFPPAACQPFLPPSAVLCLFLFLSSSRPCSRARLHLTTLSSPCSLASARSQRHRHRHVGSEGWQFPAVFGPECVVGCQSPGWVCRLPLLSAGSLASRAF